MSNRPLRNQPSANPRGGDAAAASHMSVDSTSARRGPASSSTNAPAPVRVPASFAAMLHAAGVAGTDWTVVESAAPTVACLHADTMHALVNGPGAAAVFEHLGCRLRDVAKKKPAAVAGRMPSTATVAATSPARQAADQRRRIWSEIARVAPATFGIGPSDDALARILAGDAASALHFLLSLYRFMQSSMGTESPSSTSTTAAATPLEGTHMSLGSSMGREVSAGVIFTNKPRRGTADDAHGDAEEERSNPPSVYALKTKDVQFMTYVWKLERIQRFVRSKLSARLCAALYYRELAVLLCQAWWRLQRHLARKRRLARRRLPPSTMTSPPRRRESVADPGGRRWAPLDPQHRCAPIVRALEERCAHHEDTAVDEADSPDDAPCFARLTLSDELAHGYVAEVCPGCAEVCHSTVSTHQRAMVTTVPAAVRRRLKELERSRKSATFDELDQDSSFEIDDPPPETAASAVPTGILLIQACARGRTAVRKRHERWHLGGRAAFAKGTATARLFSRLWMVVLVGRLIGRWQDRGRREGTLASHRDPASDLGVCDRCRPFVEVLQRKCDVGSATPQREHQMHVDKFLPLMCVECRPIAEGLVATRKAKTVRVVRGAVWAVVVAVKWRRRTLRGRIATVRPTDQAVSAALLFHLPAVRFANRTLLLHCRSCVIRHDRAMREHVPGSGPTPAPPRCRRAICLQPLVVWYCQRILTWYRSPRGGKEAATLPPDAAKGRWMLPTRTAEMWTAFERKVGKECVDATPASPTATATSPNKAVSFTAGGGSVLLSRSDDRNAPAKSTAPPAARGALKGGKAPEPNSFRQIVAGVHEFMDRAIARRTRFAQRLRFRVMQKEADAMYKSTVLPSLAASRSRRRLGGGDGGPPVLLNWAIPKAPAKGRWCARCDTIIESLHLVNAKGRWVGDYAAVKTTCSSLLCGPATAGSVTSCRFEAAPVLRLLSNHRWLRRLALFARAIGRLAAAVFRRRRVAATLLARGGAAEAGDALAFSASIGATSMALLAAEEDLERFGGRTPFAALSAECAQAVLCAETLTWLSTRYQRTIGALAPPAAGTALVRHASAGRPIKKSPHADHLRRVAQMDLAAMLRDEDADGGEFDSFRMGLCQGCSGAAMAEHDRRVANAAALLNEASVRRRR